MPTTDATGSDRQCTASSCEGLMPRDVYTYETRAISTHIAKNLAHAIASLLAREAGSRQVHLRRIPRVIRYRKVVGPYAHGVRGHLAFLGRVSLNRNRRNSMNCAMHIIQYCKAISPERREKQWRVAVEQTGFSSGTPNNDDDVCFVRNAIKIF